MECSVYYMPWMTRALAYNLVLNLEAVLSCGSAIRESESSVGIRNREADVTGDYVAAPFLSKQRKFCPNDWIFELRRTKSSVL